MRILIREKEEADRLNKNLRESIDSLKNDKGRLEGQIQDLLNKNA
jgi:hypothetical protein